LEFEKLIIFALFALPPVLGWLIFWRRRINEPEPARVLGQLFLLGVVAALPLILLRESGFAFTKISLPFISIVLFASCEEALKGLFLILGVELNKSRFDKWEDGFEFAVLVALGFAFTENVFYFLREVTTGGLNFDFWSIYFFRSLGTMLGHIIFTGTFGYFYACAYVVKKLVPSEKREKPLTRFFRNVSWVLRRPFHITFHHFIPQRDSARGHTSGEVVLEGFLVAIFLHVFFNSLLFFSPFDKELGFLVVPFLILGGWWYARRFKKGQAYSLHPEKKV